ncbi:hypothetical protein SAMN05216436_107141 [bacterium A37T11]|nr:hypothetical protein SAMN05216436_107141 [bacterium A37T11]
MRQNKVLTNYDRLNDHELSTLAGGVVLALTGNPNFPTPTPTLADFTALVDDYRVKLDVANRKGSTLDFSLKKEAKEALQIAMRKLSININLTADGNAPMLYSSGFPLGAQPQATQSPDRVLRVLVSDGRQSGQMRLDFEPVKKAREYEYQAGTKPEGSEEIVWGNILNTTTTRANVIPVTPDEIYYVRVRARNGKGIGDWSEVVSLRAR